MTNRNRIKEKDLQMTQTQAQLRFSPNEVPTIEQCRQNVIERAYELWEAAGSPEGNDGVDFYLQAEVELYGSPIQGGYRIYVAETHLASPTPKILTFNGDLKEYVPSTQETALV